MPSPISESASAVVRGKPSAASGKSTALCGLFHGLLAESACSGSSWRWFDGVKSTGGVLMGLPSCIQGLSIPAQKLLRRRRAGADTSRVSEGSVMRKGSRRCCIAFLSGCSSVGRASWSLTEGRRFEPCRPATGKNCYPFAAKPCITSLTKSANTNWICP